MLRKTRNKRIAEGATAKPKGRALLHRRKARIEEQDVEPLHLSLLQNEDGDETARYADAYVLPDGTVHEYGGQHRAWASEAEFHRQRGWKAGALFFPVRPRQRSSEPETE